MKLEITKDGTSHRGQAKKAGDIVEESDNNHVGALQCAGAKIVPADTPITKAPAPKKKTASKTSD